MTVVFWHKFTRSIDLGSGNMKMNVDTAGHDYHALGIDAASTLRDRLYYSAIFDTDISNFTINVVDGVVDCPIDDTYC